MGRVLVLRPQSNIGRFHAYGYCVDEKLGEWGGFYVESEDIARNICEGLARSGIPDWAYVRESGQAKPAAEPSASEPDPKPRVVRDKFAYRRALVAEAKRLVQNGKEKISLRAKNPDLEFYIRENGGEMP